MNRGIIALAVIVAAVVAVIALGGGHSTNGQTQPVNKPDPARPKPPPGPEIVVPEKFVLECEKPTKLEDKAPDGTLVMRIGSAHMGKTIGYLEIPDGWIKTCGLENVKGEDTGGKLPGKAFYEFETKRDDEFYICLRAKWMDSCGNSVWVRIDDKPYVGVEDEIGKIDDSNYKWMWHPVTEMAKIKGFKLSAGKHVLELNTKEDGPMFDKVLISTDANVPGESEVDP